MEVRSQNFTLPYTAPNGQGTVYVVRPFSTGKIIRFNVFLDDQKDESEMGYNRGAQYVYFPVASGKHTIYSKAENWAAIDVDVKPNDIVFVKQDAEMGIAIARNSLSIIDPVAGKYYVMKTKLGSLSKAVKGSTAPVNEKKPESQSDTASKLKKLQELRDKGLITQEEYDTKRSKILETL
jgi:hypothetical protein